MMTENKSTNQIITFYSYKGGTGRSMALANVACLLAQNCKPKENVLMIDWDLEAPGLHEFFRDQFCDDNNINNKHPLCQMGLIELFNEMEKRLKNNNYSEEIPYKFFENLDLEKYYLELKIPSLKLLPAGRFDDKQYSKRVNSFNWEEFFYSHPTVITCFAEFLRTKFKYILVDSRTGYTDISGICTSIMPEILVAVFTPNRQSISGVIEIIRKSVEYRKQSDDLRTLMIFPLASRIENAEYDLQREWRFGNKDKGIQGYQKRFEELFLNLYDLPECNLNSYFNNIQIQYIPKYSYGEEIAVLEDKDIDRLSLTRSFTDFTNVIVNSKGPWDTRKSIDKNNASGVHIEHDIFFSYSYKDKTEASAIYDYLKSYNQRIFLSEERMNSKYVWGETIKNAIRNSKLIILLISPNTINSEWIDQEISAGWVLDIPMIPILLDISWDEIPNKLKSIHGLKFRNFREGLNKYFETNK